MPYVIHVGCLDGDDDGTVVGMTEGTNVGSLDDKIVVGENVGFRVGFTLGLDVGNMGGILGFKDGVTDDRGFIE